MFPNSKFNDNEFTKLFIRIIITQTSLDVHFLIGCWNVNLKQARKSKNLFLIYRK